MRPLSTEKKGKLTGISSKQKAKKSSKINVLKCTCQGLQKVFVCASEVKSKTNAFWNFKVGPVCNFSCALCTMHIEYTTNIRLSQYI